MDIGGVWLTHQFNEIINISFNPKITQTQKKTEHRTLIRKRNIERTSETNISKQRKEKIYMWQLWCYNQKITENILPPDMKIINITNKKLCKFCFHNCFTLAVLFFFCFERSLSEPDHLRKFFLKWQTLLLLL